MSAMFTFTTLPELGRYAWRHDSVLNFIDKSLSLLSDSSLYADLATFLSPSVNTGNSFLST